MNHRFEGHFIAWKIGREYGYQKETDAINYDLTEREKEILALMVDGLPNLEIANRLVVSQSTVKFHVSNVLSKLGVTSRTEAVSLALKHHLVK